MATLKDIQAKIAKFQAQAEAIAKKETQSAIAKIHSIMANHGLSFEDLRQGSARNVAPAAKSAAGKGASLVKYRDPKSGATWSGHGRAPGWIANAKSRDKFLVDADAAPATAPAKKAAKPGRYVRGPQPALYRDPASGATWSGRGKAPAWLASAKDRTSFLIDKSATESSTKAPSAKKVAATKKSAASKKTATTKKTVATKKTPAVKKTAAAKQTSVTPAAAKKAPATKAAGTKKAATKKLPTVKKVAAKKSKGGPAAESVMSVPDATSTAASETTSAL
jgi:DNA-binding protein H-NS